MSDDLNLTIRAIDLKAGDKIIYNDTPVTIQRAAEPHTDLFARQGIKLWASTEDKEGYIIFGMSGIAVLQ